jgi:hypothetical protein
MRHLPLPGMQEVQGSIPSSDKNCSLGKHNNKEIFLPQGSKHVGFKCIP